MAKVINENIVRDFVKALKAERKKPSAYDTTAKVLRVDGDTAWVHIAGGVDETPIKKTINAKAGDAVQVRVGGGSAWIVGNQSAPPTDDAKAIVAENKAVIAEAKAVEALSDAERAEKEADRAKVAADEAETHAQEAKVSADNAGEYASRALGNLATVQSVAETLTWITQHGTMALTTDTALDPTHVYFVRDANGDYTVGSYTYSIVTEPVLADISTYYELSIDESLNNYVGTHLALTNEGLWLLPASSGTNKVLIATGAGSTYTTAGTYIIGSGGELLASFKADGLTVQTYDNNETIGIAHLGYGESNNEGVEENSPYYTFGKRKATNTPYSSSATYAIGDLCIYNDKTYVCISEITTPEAWNGGHWQLAYGSHSVAEGTSLIASGSKAHAEGYSTTAIGYSSHSEGAYTLASNYESHAEGRHSESIGFVSHAEGDSCKAIGNYSHAQNIGTIAAGQYQTAIGQYNVKDTNDEYALIIGNGADGNNRSNSLTVDWNGNVEASGDITDGAGNVLSDKADKSAFVVQSATINLTSVSGNTASEFTQNVTKAGHYPIGVVGFSIATGSLVARRMYIDNKTSGGCRAVANVRNVTSSATSASTASVDILWIKE